MRQVPYEIAHYATHSQAGNELEETDCMEKDARVVAWSRLRSSVESLEHCAGNVISRCKRDCMKIIENVD